MYSDMIFGLAENIQLTVGDVKSTILPMVCHFSGGVRLISKYMHNETGVIPILLFGMSKHSKNTSKRNSMNQFYKGKHTNHIHN